RLRVAGCQTAIFTASALRELYRRSKGIPRLINVVADRALLAAYTQDRIRVDGRLVRLAASEVFGRRIVPFASPWALASAGIAAMGLGIWGLFAEPPGGRPEPAPSAPATPAAAPPTPPPASGSPSARTTFGTTETRTAAADAPVASRGASAPADTSDAVPLDELLADPAFATDT